MKYLRRCWCWFIDGRVGTLRRPDAAAWRPYLVTADVSPLILKKFDPTCIGCYKFLENPMFSHICCDLDAFGFLQVRIGK